MCADVKLSGRTHVIPRELAPQAIEFPKTDRYTIVLITGGALRHRRFAYRIRKEFGDLVIGWFQYEYGPPAVRAKATPAPSRSSRVAGKLRKLASLNPRIYREAVSTRVAARRHQKLRALRRIRQEQAERMLFAEEVEQLAQETGATPVKVAEPNGSEFLETIRKLDPYFFLSLGGPLYRKELLAAARGAAINQHAGWSPTYRGANTVEWALYHRNLDGLGATVHITAPGADSGPILRRSHPCLTSRDTPETCFCRVVALGTELICEVVRNIMDGRPLQTYPQPLNEGRTYLSRQLDDAILREVYRDFEDGWLGRELNRLRAF